MSHRFTFVGVVDDLELKILEVIVNSPKPESIVSNSMSQKSEFEEE